MPQHIAIYRSVAEKRTIKRVDPTPRYQLPVWRGVITSDCQRPYNIKATAHMHALHSFGRLTERRSLPTQLSSRRYSAVGGFNGPRAERLLPEQESSGEPVMNFYQTTLTASIAALFVRRVEG
jgi:hypothetical protein